MSDWYRRRLVDSDGNEEGNLGENVEAPTVRGETDSMTAQTESLPPNESVTYTSQLGALFITVNVTIGAGLLAMPYAMQISGLAASIVIQLVFLLLIVTTCIICTELTVKSNVNSFHQMVKAHCHHYVYQICQGSLLLMVFAVTVAFIVIIGDQADRVFASQFGSDFCYKWYLNRRFIMSFATVFIIKPLCSAKTVDFLKYGSFAGVISLGFVMYVVTSQFIKQDQVAKDVQYLPERWIDGVTILPVFCLAYQCHLSWIPTVATTRKEEKYRSYVTITIAMVISTIVYMLVCILAVLTFGKAIFSDFTESYSNPDWTVTATIGIIAFKCIMTIPAAFLPLRLSLIDILSGVSPKFSGLSEPIKRYSVTFSTLSVALILALFVPDILTAVNLIGFLAVMFIFTLPGLCYLNLIKENRMQKQQLAGLSTEAPIYSLKDKFKRAISYFFIVFGLVMSALVLYRSINELTTKAPSIPICHK